MNNIKNWLEVAIVFDLRQQEKVEHLMKDIVALVFFASLANAMEDFEVQMATMRGMFELLALVILVAVACIITLVLFLVIKTAILRRRKELGIQKALGFTTFQLMNQMAMNLTLPIVFGVIAGTIAGVFGFNPLMSISMRGAGIVNMNLPIPMDWVIVLSVGLILFAYLISMLVSYRIRKISAYRLVTE
jgi:putative ABC transport system permease protein